MRGRPMPNCLDCQELETSQPRNLGYNQTWLSKQTSKSLKWFLMAFCFACRSLSCPVVIREAFKEAYGNMSRNPQPDINYAERVSKLEVFIGSLPLELSEPHRRRRKDCKSQSGLRTPRECGPLNQLSRAHMESQRLKRQAHRDCVYLRAVSLVLV